MHEVEKSDREWRANNCPTTNIGCARQKGTERPFSGEYWDTTTPGEYSVPLLRCGSVRVGH